MRVNRQVPPGIDIYPVGVLEVLLGVWRSVLACHGVALRHSLGRVRWWCRLVRQQVRDRQWRALRSQFNGYLAEPAVWPEGLRRCGSGWTRGRALRSLQRHGYPAATPARR